MIAGVKGRFLMGVALLGVSLASFASPIDLGEASQYTLLGVGSQYGSVGLGSAAQIYGNVGARNGLTIGDAAVVHGNAKYGSLSREGSGSISGNASHEGNSYWNGVYDDLKSASLAAKGMTADRSYGLINTSTVFNSAEGSIFAIGGVNLGAGNTLTLKGSSTDKFIINVGGYFSLGGGAGIVLDGVSADNVLFNLYGQGNAASISAAAGSLAGTFIAPNGFFTLGDGLNLDDGVRFLADGILGNFQDVEGIPGDPGVSDVPEPASWGLLVLGLVLVGCGLLRRRRNGILSSLRLASGPQGGQTAKWPQFAC